MQALFDDALLRLPVCQTRLGGASCRPSHVRDAPLATVGPKKTACRGGPQRDENRGKSAILKRTFRGPVTKIAAARTK